MPKVGNKKFPYTAKGKAAAKKAAAKNKRHEMTEGPAERKMEYGSAKAGKTKSRKAK